MKGRSGRKLCRPRSAAPQRRCASRKDSDFPAAAVASHCEILASADPSHGWVADTHAEDLLGYRIVGQAPEGVQVEQHARTAAGGGSGT
jgi:hypothetical protein